MKDSWVTPGASGELGGQKPIEPGAGDTDSEIAKLPNRSGEVSDVALRLKLDRAWAEYMENGFKNAEQMFKQTLKAYMRPYYVTIAMYIVLFIVGIGLFVTAAILALQTDKSVAAIAFGGLSVATFLLFFIRHPLQALEENLEFITWLGVAFNTYWARLMYMQDKETIQVDLKAAADDYGKTIVTLIDKHGAMRAKRPGIESPEPSGDSGKESAKPQTEEKTG